MDRMIGNFNSLYKVQSLSNVPSVNFGCKEIKDAMQWLVDVEISSVMIVAGVIVPMENVGTSDVYLLTLG